MIFLLSTYKKAYEYYGHCSQIQYFKDQNLSVLVNKHCDIIFQNIFESVISNFGLQAFNSIRLNCAGTVGVTDKTSAGSELVTTSP